jgi:hypothetical protein
MAMPHFGDRLDEEDPALLRKLRAMLHPRGDGPRPTRAARFGEAPLAPEREPEPALASDAGFAAERIPPSPSS